MATPILLLLAVFLLSPIHPQKCSISVIFVSKLWNISNNIVDCESLLNYDDNDVNEIQMCRSTLFRHTLNWVIRMEQRDKLILIAYSSRSYLCCVLTIKSSLVESFVLKIKIKMYRISMVQQWAVNNTIVVVSPWRMNIKL